MMNNEQQQRSDYLYEQHVTHLTLQGKRPGTIDGYSRALRRITHHLDKSPDTLTTNDLKRYFTQLIKTHSWSIVRIDCSGLRKLWVSYVFPYVFPDVALTTKSCPFNGTTLLSMLSACHAISGDFSTQIKM
ncbi:hypothetical protein CZ809_01846 [Photobacterium piscicola]|uniref:Integrase SAM-like N-terminal domain-containing protein n=1 Tax=Photobacterium piscicola TaxID=1378299 RepID=A0A1T5HZU4_9GAMM|nr:hypothetical protein CZ809_01846 [Photobacterium piscicola]